MQKLLVINNNSTGYEEELLLAFERISDKGKTKKILASQLNFDYLVSNDVQVIITDYLSDEWLLKLKEKNIVSIVFGKIDKYHDLADIVIDHKSSDNNKYFTGSNFSLKNNPDLNFDEIVNLVSIMQWDSDFFGFPVAFVGSMHLSENIYHHIDKFLRKEKVKLVEYLCNCHDDRSVKIAEKNQFHFTDMRLTFDMSLKNKFQVSEGDFSFEQADKSTVPALKKLTTNLYKDSRYFFDGNFDIDKINEFYSGWIEKAVKGTFDHECFCAFKGNNPVAFCSIRYNKRNTASIGLFGVSAEHSGKGLGKQLLYYVFNHLIDNGIEKMYVVTQGRNYSAQRLYQSVGFKTTSTELWYHKWLVE